MRSSKLVFGSPNLKVLKPSAKESPKQVTVVVGKVEEKKDDGSSNLVGTGVVGSMIVG